MNNPNTLSQYQYRHFLRREARKKSPNQLREEIALHELDKSRMSEMKPLTKIFYNIFLRTSPLLEEEYVAAREVLER